jgi:hypothetical protein
MADAILLDRDQEVAPTENTVGGHRGPPHQRKGAWGSELKVGGALRLRLEAELNETEKRRNGDAVKKEDRGQKTIANLGARSRSDGSAKQVHPTTKHYH